jgi:hypothetical protein
MVQLELKRKRSNGVTDLVFALRGPIELGTEVLGWTLIVVPANGEIIGWPRR